MTRVELTEQGRGPKNRTCLGLLTTCTSVVCLCALWLGGAGAESCRAGPPPPYTGTDWVSNRSPAEARNQKSHTTCPRGVRSWQADVVRQSSRCRLDSDCFPLSLTSATGDPHLSWLSAAWSVETLATNNASKTNKLRHTERAATDGFPRGQRAPTQKTEHPPFSAQVSLIHSRGICSAGDGYVSTWYFGTGYCSAPYSHLTSAVSIWCSSCFFFRVSLSKQPFFPGLANHPGPTAQNWRTCTTIADPLGRLSYERTLPARFERPHIARRSALSVSALSRDYLSLHGGHPHLSEPLGVIMLCWKHSSSVLERTCGIFC